MVLTGLVFFKKLKCKIVKARRTTHDDGQRLIALGHLSDFGDLKNYIRYHIYLQNEYVNYNLINTNYKRNDYVFVFQN